MTQKARVKYNPAFLTGDELNRSFVVRHVDLDLIIETIRENTGKVNQNILLIGPRGMGKTMLSLKTVSFITSDKELNAQWYPIIFSEESYEVFTAAEFWLRAVFHLARQTGDDELKKLHDHLREETDEKRLYERTLAFLMDFADQENKRLLLVVENLNMLLDEQIGSDDSWNLRHTLLNEPRLMLLATAPARFDGVDNPGKAMFDLFKIHYLEPLNLEESKQLWEFLTGQMVEERKVRPIQILTGGNPRLMVIISSFAVGASFRELMEQLSFLIDEYTTYFKSNIESLPALERKLFVTLANIWEPAAAARVAKDARIAVNKTSSLLKRLESRGAITVVDSKGGRKTYQVTERLYNIYHLMRLSGRQSDRVRAVVDFMVNFYDASELGRKIEHLTNEAVDKTPTSIFFNNSYASIHGANDKWNDALSIAPNFLNDKEEIKNFEEIYIISFFVDAAAAGFAQDGLAILKGSASASYFEPLIVALQMITGEKYNAPQEVVEVAQDVVKQIEEKRNSKNST